MLVLNYDYEPSNLHYLCLQYPACRGLKQVGGIRELGVKTSSVGLSWPAGTHQPLLQTRLYPYIDEMLPLDKD